MNSTVHTEMSELPLHDVEEQIYKVREMRILDWIYHAYPPPTMFHNKVEKALPLLTMRNTLVKG